MAMNQLAAEVQEQMITEYLLCQMFGPTFMAIMENESEEASNFDEKIDGLNEYF